jgi:molybdopterin converting factor small subunit
MSNNAKINLNIIYYGVLKQVRGTKEETIVLLANPSLRQVIEHLTAQHTELANRIPTTAFAINNELAPLDQVLMDGDTISLLPPVSGG